MASKAPIVSQIAWFSAFPQILLLGLFIFIYYLLGVRFFLLFGALTYLALSYGLKSFIINDHQKGIKLVKRGNFIDAIPYFEKSVKFFSENSWLDKYRYLTMLSSSKMGYREMGLCNIAFCYSQTNKGLEAKELYRVILKEYPENILANATIKMLDSLDNETN